MSDHTKIPQFFLGLLEGDGSIQVNSWKNKILQFRIVIKLKYDPKTYEMCVTIRDSLKFMNLHVRNNCIILVEDHKSKRKRFVKIVECYGLLVTHRRYQYAFFKYCFQNNVPYSKYVIIKTLGKSWPGFNHIKPYASQQLLLKPHFNSRLCVSKGNWLCGFIEAEGCFSIRSNGNLSFSIAQKDDIHLLQAIKTFLKIPNPVRSCHNRLYAIETYRISVLTYILSFLDSPTNVGLLGLKSSQFEKFKHFLETKKLARQNASHRHTNRNK